MRNAETVVRRTVLVLLVVLSWLAMAGVAQAWGSFCDDCYTKLIEENDPDNNWMDAQCCTSGSGHCAMLAADDYWLTMSDMEWCSNNWVPGWGYNCSGQSDSCSAGGGGSGGGGGGGGGNCSIRPGAWCPAECASCEISY